MVQTFDAGTHLIFIGELVNAEILDDSKEPLTYSYYRQVKKGVAPKNAPTYIDKSKLETNKYKYIYQKNINVLHADIFMMMLLKILKFKDLPDDWVCPVCGI